MTPAHIAQARTWLDEQLVDYPRARFRNVEARTFSTTFTFCGDVNTPNRMGGMSGWTPFAIVALTGVEFKIAFGRDAAGFCTGERIDQTDYAPALTAG